MPLYVIGVEGRPEVRIGHAVDVGVRLKTLQHGSPARLRLLAEGEGDAERRLLLHRRFRPWRTEGEWFALPADERAYAVRVVSTGEPVIQPRRPRRNYKGNPIVQCRVPPELDRAIEVEASRAGLGRGE